MGSECSRKGPLFHTEALALGCTFPKCMVFLVVPSLQGDACSENCSCALIVPSWDVSS